MRYANRSMFLCTLCLFVSTQHAHATTVCAADVAQINTAISQAAVDSTGMTIHVVTGDYTLSPTGFDNASAPALGSLVFQGGYNADCSAHANGAATTTFTGVGGAGLRLKAAGNLRLSDMSFVGLQGHSELTLLGSESDDLILERATFRDSVSTSLLVQMTGAESGRISMQNVLVFGAENAGGCVVTVAGNAGKALLANNTIADSSASMGLCVSGQMEKQVYANIVWNISGTDFVSSGSDVLSVHNVYSEFAGTMSPGSTDNFATDPEFVDPSNGDYGLGVASLSINTGGTYIPGGLASFDLLGSSRVLGSQVDRGALESTASDLLVFTVSNTGDGAAINGDPGTLRRAISDANEAGQPALIEFALGAGCPQNIDIDRVLPKIAVPMVIDGTTQPGSTLNTAESAFDAHICVVIAASRSVPSVPEALFVQSANPTSVTVRGLAFSGIVSPLKFYSGSGHRVLGNQFGGSLPSGPLFLRLDPNDISIAFTGTSSDSIIGGPDRIDRNVIDGDTGFTGIGIFVGGLENDSTEVRNNLIGINRGGTTAAPLGQGIVAINSGHVIVDNRIGACSTDAIRLSTADHVTVQNNEIGGLLPNAVGVILNADSSSNTIGAAAAETGRGNRITNNLDGAVWIDATAGIFNRVRDNQLLAVPAAPANDAMVLDLGVQGADSNDPGDADSGPNNRLNYPELANPVHAANAVSFTAKLDVPIGDYTLDVYTASRCLSNGRAMADRKLLTLNVSKPQSGVITLPVSLPANALNPLALGATLTDSGGSTSELSNCLDVDRIFADDFE